MAIVVCPECKKQVSQYAEHCPDCGFPIKEYMEKHNLIDTYKKMICPKCAHMYAGFGEDSDPIYLNCKFCNTPVIQTDITQNDFYKIYENPNTTEIEKELANQYGNNRFSQEAYEHRLSVIAEENNKHEAERKQESQQQNIPKCPICQSTDLSKISNTKKAAKIGLFGLFGAGDIGKTWQCNNCGSRF